MRLFMTELTVANLSTSRDWYRDRLGLQVLHQDPHKPFALLQGADGGRLSLKQGEPVPGGLMLYFEVESLDPYVNQLAITPDAIKTSPEGYRRATVTDPDGYRIGIFEWLTTQEGPPSGHDPGQDNQ